MNINPESNPITEIAHFFKRIDYDKLIKGAGSFLLHIKDQAGIIGYETTKVMLELYYVMLDENTSKLKKYIIAGALAYNLLPNDLMPQEDYGFLGFLDNTAVLYFAYKRVKDSVTPEIEAKVNKTLEEWAISIREFTIMKEENKKL